MNVKEVERIEGLIKQAEIEGAKAEGQIQSIKEQWKKNYGTDDENEIRNILKEAGAKLNKTQERQEVLFNELMECCNWEELEGELF